MSATVPAGQLDLLQNHPNPFNASTKISFVVPERAHARLDVYRVDGTYVTSLLDRTVEGGAVSLFWDGRDASGNPVSSGIYFYSLWTDGRTLTKKMVLIK
jgi:hypothetical protein